MLEHSFVKAAGRRDWLAEQLLRCGWIHAVDTPPEGGVKLYWTPLGDRRSLLLKRVIPAFGLNWPGISLVKFTSGDFPAGTNHTENERAAARYWSACVGELKISGDELALRMLVGLIGNRSRDTLFSILKDRPLPALN